MNRKPSEKIEFDMEEETKGGKKTGGDMKLTVGARGKAVYSLWVEKNIERNNPPFKRKKLKPHSRIKVI